MSAFGNDVVSGYQLITNRGDIYCYGDTDFFGSVSQKFNIEVEIVACAQLPDGLTLVSPDGKWFQMGPVCEQGQYEVGSDTIVDCVVYQNQLLMMTANGHFISAAKVVPKLDMTKNSASKLNFVSCALTASGDDIIAVTDKGLVFATDSSLLDGDFASLEINDVKVVSIETHPVHNGYWIIDSIGGVFCFGIVDYFGSVPGDNASCEASKFISTPGGHGYWIIDKNGMVLPYGNAIFFGAPKKHEVSGEIIDMQLFNKAHSSSHETMFDKLIQNDMNLLLGNEVNYIPEPSADFR